MGRPADLYTTDGNTPADPRDLILESFTTYDLEAVYLAKNVATFDGDFSQRPDAAESQEQTPLDLLNFGALKVGSLAVIRRIPDGLTNAQFSTRDWLEEMIKGATRKVHQAPLVEVGQHAAAGHPLLVDVQWDEFGRAREIRDQMDQYQGNRSQYGGVDTDVGAATTAWYVDRVPMTDATGQWPWLNFTGASWLEFKKPKTKLYWWASPVKGVPPRIHRKHRSSTRSFPKLNGFDDYDLEAAMAVTQVVRNARDLTRPVDLALVLALADREGYLAMSARRRGEQEQKFNLSTAHAVFRPGGATDASIPPEYQGRDALGVYGARTIWSAQHYGMDRLTTEQPANPHSQRDKEFARDVDTTFDSMITELTTRDGRGLAILDPDFLATDDVGRFIDERLSFPFRGPASLIADMRVASPRLQYVGMALESALFQWFHKKIVNTTGASDDYLALDEYTLGTLPEMGSDANSDIRRKYLAYYAAIYLAYNTASGPGEFNYWLGRAESKVAAASSPAQSHDLPTTWLVFNADPSHLAATGFSTRTKQNREGQVGHLTRFALVLDAYCRLDAQGNWRFDYADPHARNW